MEANLILYILPLCLLGVSATCRELRVDQTNIYDIDFELLASPWQSCILSTDCPTAQDTRAR